MLKRLTRLTACLITVLLAPIAQAGLPAPLVDVGWLDAHKTEVVILDIRISAETFARTGHIPGAVFIGWRDIRADRVDEGAELVGMLPGAEDFAALMRRTGVSDESQIVIVSGGHNATQVTFAARLYWQMKYFGHDAVALLDGGIAAWRSAGLPVSHDAPTVPATGSFTIRAQRREILATLDTVETALFTRSATLLDARDFGQYLGVYRAASVEAGGHIPGARFAPIDAFLTPGPVKRFLDQNTLRRAMQGLGADGPSIVYCNTGHFAAGTWFAFREIAGNPQVSLYDGSLSEWTRKGRPVAAFVEPPPTIPAADDPHAILDGAVTKTHD